MRRDAANQWIDTIVDHLISNTYSKSEVTAVVRAEITHVLPLQLEQDPVFGKQAANRTCAQEIGELARALIRKIEGAPRGTRNVIRILASRTEPLPWSLRDPHSPAAKAYEQKLFKALADLQHACDSVESNYRTIGEHHNTDQAKQVCAGAALDLIVGLDAGKPTNSVDESPIRVIAGALFAAIHRSMRSPDLKDHCADVIAYWRKMSAADRKAHIDQTWVNWEFTGMTARKSASYP